MFPKKVATIRELKISLGKLIKKSIDLRIEASKSSTPEEALVILSKVDKIRSSQENYALEIISREGINPSMSVFTGERESHSDNSSVICSSSKESWGLETFACNDSNSVIEFKEAFRLEDFMGFSSLSDVEDITML